MRPRHVDTLVRTQFTVVLHFHDQTVTFFSDNLHIQFAVIEEYIVTYIDILRNIRIRQIYLIVRGILVRISIYSYLLTDSVLYRFIVTRRTHFRSFLINKDTDMARYSACITDDGTYTVGRSMCGIHSYHIHSCIK